MKIANGINKATEKIGKASIERIRSAKNIAVKIPIIRAPVSKFSVPNDNLSCVA